MNKSADTRGVPHPGDRIKIPLDEKTAVIGLFKVKPTKDMPHPGANPTKAKKASKRRRKTSDK